MRQKLTMACLFPGLMAVMALTPALLNAQINPNELVGSWHLTFTPKTPATPPVAPVPGLATFTSDGTVVETDGTEAVPIVVSPTPAVFGTPGHGIWQPGPAIGTLFIQFFNLEVNANGTLHATKMVTITGTLDSTGNNFSGSYSFELTDPTGHVVSGGSGALTGQKIPHPLLP